MMLKKRSCNGFLQIFIKKFNVFSVTFSEQETTWSAPKGSPTGQPAPGLLLSTTHQAHQLAL